MREPWAAPQVAPRGAFGPRNPLYGDESHGARFFDQFATALDALDCLGKQELGLAVENASVSGAFVEPGAELFDGQGLKYFRGIQDLDQSSGLSFRVVRRTHARPGCGPQAILRARRRCSRGGAVTAARVVPRVCGR